MARQFKVAVKKERNYDCSGHHFGIDHLPLRIFKMMKGFKRDHIITQAKDCNNLSVHAIHRFVIINEPIISIDE